MLENIVQLVIAPCMLQGPCWHSGNTLTYQLQDWSLYPCPTSNGTARMCLPFVGCLQWKTSTNCIFYSAFPTARHNITDRKEETRNTASIWMYVSVHIVSLIGLSY